MDVKHFLFNKYKEKSKGGFLFNIYIYEGVIILL